MTGCAGYVRHACTCHHCPTLRCRFLRSMRGPAIDFTPKCGFPRGMRESAPNPALQYRFSHGMRGSSAYFILAMQLFSRCAHLGNVFSAHTVLKPVFPLENAFPNCAYREKTRIGTSSLLAACKPSRYRPLPQNPRKRNKTSAPEARLLEIESTPPREAIIRTQAARLL